MTTLLQERYITGISKLKESLNVSNIHQLPKLRAITVNTGIGGYRTDNDRVNQTKQALAKITGQLPKSTASRKSVSGFKVREGEIVGLATTLRGKRMYDFLGRLINIYLPRRREFAGLALNQFDRQGNITLSFRDQTIFAELANDFFAQPLGVSITISITNSSPDKSLILLNLLGFPLKKR